MVPTVRYMLDTNICIYLMKHQPPAVARRFERCQVGDVVMSSITYAELAYGAAASTEPNRIMEALSMLIEDIPVVAFDQAAGASYAAIRLATRNRKTDMLDKLIAAHASSLGVTLVTNNRKDFDRYPGLTVENWLELDD